MHTAAGNPLSDEEPRPPDDGVVDRRPTHPEYSGQTDPLVRPPSASVTTSPPPSMPPWDDAGELALWSSALAAAWLTAEIERWPLRHAVADDEA
ncbi:hypothetical protein GCM10010885_15560 [Alicyclobacillus cellulosilyticus]|uniref:Uncharacterized protein n=1 Tax=Alicyclobacillus cellulosilyticus TaxID=1003997 RepID=A0A917KBR7_9BACL|nr:hypothetical protein [Alicyclobacillus cellulosilyticus]GGJ07302.1 hypothetical protein GCM10010885_15560 [Alicyclobacillus cellulosilyticus]